MKVEAKNMLKRCLDFENDFNEDCIVYDCNVRDYFGNKFYIIYNTTLEQVRFMNKNKEYKKERRILDEKGLQHVIKQKWGDIIDIKKETYKQIQTFFPDAKLPCVFTLNIW